MSANTLLAILAMAILPYQLALTLPAGNSTSQPDLGSYIYSCYDAAQTRRCKGAPYNFRCSLDGNIGYDTPDDYCRDITKCGCDYVGGPCRGCS